MIKVKTVKNESSAVIFLVPKTFEVDKDFGTEWFRDKALNLENFTPKTVSFCCAEPQEKWDGKCQHDTTKENFGSELEKVLADEIPFNAVSTVGFYKEHPLIISINLEAKCVIAVVKKENEELLKEIKEVIDKTEE